MSSRRSRSPIEILVDLLYSSQYGGSRSAIIKRACLQYRQGAKYFDLLESRGLVCRVDAEYHATSKGERTLSNLEVALRPVKDLQYYAPELKQSL